MADRIIHRESLQHEILSLEDKKVACEDCQNFKMFGKNCWYYWEFKKECSQKIE